MDNFQHKELSYVMELLNISGQKLADNLMVSRSLVSKWKNGKLPFNPSIYHFENVVDVIIKINNKQQVKNLERFIEQLIPNIDKNSPKWVQKYLRLWLAGNLDVKETIVKNDSDSSLYNTNIKVYQGNQGKRDAFTEFFNYLLELPPGQEILFSDMEDMSWLFESKQFMLYWKSMMISAIKNNHKLNIVHNTGRDITSIAKIIFSWLPLYFSGNIQSHFYPNIDYSITPLTIYVIKDHIAIMSLCPLGNPKDRYTTVYKDPLSVKQMEKIFKVRYEKSEILVDVFDSSKSSLERLTKKILTAGRRLDDIYAYVPTPVYSTMNHETLLAVLNDNNLPSSVIDMAMTIHHEFHEAFIKNLKKYNCRQFHDIDTIRQYMEKPESICLELSSIAQSPITVSNKLFKKHMEYIIKLLDTYPNFQIALIPFDTTPVPTNTNVWVKQNCLIYAYPQTNGRAVVLSTESMTVYGFFEKLDLLWTNTPLVNKDITWVKEQFRKLL